ncbi:hypothetical protein E1956_44370 (plasmid) [Paraburkholderia pallida]|uniref:Uncharacterized protein n=1 Tax=Paraburkholderia pallida TaxID=2547399 RepID=A0A4P7DBQ9_9BURK|nr:hypothetical protein E1956_44370 [Paraburkholderia pallida]
MTRAWRVARGVRRAACGVRRAACGGRQRVADERDLPRDPHVGARGSVARVRRRVVHPFEAHARHSAKSARVRRGARAGRCVSS